MSTTPHLNKRNAELSEIEIEELLNDVWARLPLEAKRSIMWDHIERATLVMLEHVSSQRKQIERDSPSALNTYTGPLTIDLVRKAKEAMSPDET